jgi:uncharacterized protein (DUF4415 family)
MANEERITRVTLEEALRLPDLTDWDRLRREQAEGIEPEEDDPEDAFDWTDAVVVQRPGKAALSIRVDADVLAFFKEGGKGWQTRMNAVLRAWMQAQKAKSGG